MKRNPYVGPRPYERQDRHNFYGRDREARELLALILSERVVLFYAQSGAGKTSLLNAKVIPALEEEDFHVLPVARVGSDLPPEVDPWAVENIFVFSTLLALAGEEIPPAALLQRTLRSFLEDCCPEPGGDVEPRPPLLVLDQFEELFTTQHDRWLIKLGVTAMPASFEELFTTQHDRWREVRGFFLQLREALDALPSLGVLLTMREDYVPGLDPYVHLFPRRLRARFWMEPLRVKGALEAVVKPAANAGCTFAPGVAERLVDDLRLIKVPRRLGAEGEDSALLGPFIEPVQLQVVCNRLWENLPEQEDQVIQWEEVEQYGDIDRALADYYESVLVQAVEETGVSERQLRRWFGEELITPMGTRGQAVRGEEETAGLPNAAVDLVLGRHLIGAEMRAGACWHELAHDRLVDPILEANRAWDAAQETPLRLAARQWEASEESSLLYRGQALLEALSWAEAHPDEVEPEEQAFLEASQKGEIGRKRRRNLAIAGSVIALAVIVLVSYLALAANWARRVAHAGQLAAIAMGPAVNQEQRILLLRMSVEEHRTPEAEIALRQALVNFYPSEALTGTGKSAYSVAFRPDGRWLAAGMDNGDIMIWDTETRQLLQTLREPGMREIWGLSFSPDGQSLVFGGSNGRIRILNLEQGVGIDKTLVGQKDKVYSLDLSPDGRYLVSSGKDKRVFLWDLWTTVVITLTEQAASVPALAEQAASVPSVALTYGPGGDLVVGAGFSNDVILLWELVHDSDSQLVITAVHTLAGHTGPVNCVAFDPGGEFLASGSSDRTIRIWDVSSGEAFLTLVGHEDEVRAIAFSADGRYLISGSRDTTVRIWDVKNRRREAVATLTGHTSLINGVAFSPDGRFLASASGEGMVRLWDSQPSAGVMLTTLILESGAVASLDFSPDGRHLASGGSDGVARIWSWETGEQVARLQSEGSGTVWDVTYDSGGDHLVTCTTDGVVRIWNVATGEIVQVLKGHTADANVAVYHPDGRFIATASDDRTARVWDTSTGEYVQVLVGHSRAVFALAYSPDGQYVATGSTDDDVRIWDVRLDSAAITRSSVLTLTGHTHDVYSVAFSPDGKTLASGSWDGTVRLWELRRDSAGTLRVGQVTILAGEWYVYSVEYSPDGRYLLAGSWDGAVRLWDLSQSPPQAVAILKGHTDRVNVIAYSPDGKYLASGSSDGTIRRYLANFEDVLELSREYVPREMTDQERAMLLGE